MKIQIDKGGKLLIERAGKMKSQLCPFSFYSAHIDDWVYCGDWCPLFSEPFYTDENRIVHIGLCHRTEIHCKAKDFLDERTTNTQES
jgi:hypothetical protein